MNYTLPASVCAGIAVTLATYVIVDFFALLSARYREKFLQEAAVETAARHAARRCPTWRDGGPVTAEPAKRSTVATASVCHPASIAEPPS